ncbi:MAG TPA: cold shock domain-containing protein [Actinomycetota bacterium]|nr:cold shock domain-containing protein [Actinomycetota bacterium]
MAQGTIKSYDHETRSGVILDDDKNELFFDLDSFRGSGLRELRLGQRVKYNVLGEAPRQKVRELQIVTM